MAKNRLARTKFDPDIDWNDVGETFSLASGSKVWAERDGAYINILTDGDPKKVIDLLVKKAAELIVDESLFEAVAWIMSDMEKWERNARLN